jgi:dolichol-phosphate mannosyltransferase
MTEKVSIILPTYNEKYNIARLIRAILGIVNPYEIIVVDDNSPDGTWKIVQKMAARNRKIRLTRRTGERGVGSAIYRGIREAKGNIVVWMDCDFSMPPSAIPKLLRELDRVDMAIGSRYVKGGKDYRGTARVLASFIINSIARFVLMAGVTDYTSGFVAARKKVFSRVKFDTRGHGEYCIELLYNAKRAGIKISEVPYIFTERKVGEPKTSQYVYSIFLNSMTYFLKVLRLRMMHKAVKL